MEASIFIYMASVLGSSNNAAGFVVVVSTIATVVFLLGYVFNRFEYVSDFERREMNMNTEEVQVHRSKPWWGAAKTSIKVLSVSLFAAIVIPSERTMWLMAGAYLGQSAIQSEVSEEIQDILKLKLREYRDDMAKDIGIKLADSEKE